MTPAGNAPSCDDAPQLEQRIAHDYFCRFHMSVILAAVISSGVLASKCLLELHVSLGFRYPIAVLASYCVFLLLIRIWIWYIAARTGKRNRSGGVNFGGVGGSWNFGGSGGGAKGGFSGFGGGDSGGAGASDAWAGNEAAAAVVAQPHSSGGGSHWWSGSFSGGDSSDNAWLVVLLLGALIACILGGGVYLIVAAPHILPEAAAQVLLAGAMTNVSKDHHHNWMQGVVRSTWIPFLIVLVLAGGLGWEAHRYCPAARRLIDVFNCPGK